MQFHRFGMCTGMIISDVYLVPDVEFVSSVAVIILYFRCQLHPTVASAFIREHVSSGARE